MGTTSKYNDSDAMYRLVLEHLDLKDDVELRVDEYGKDMYFISVGKMSNPLETRAVAWSMQTIFMTDEEIESGLVKVVDSLHSQFTDRDMIKDIDPTIALIEDLQAAGVSEALLAKVLFLVEKADTVTALST